MIERSPELRELMLKIYLHFASGKRSPSQFLSSDPSVTVLGSDPREIFEGFETISTLWDGQVEALGGWTISPERIEAFEDGDFGWGYTIGRLSAGPLQVDSWRETWIVHREDGEWKAVHAHVSVGVANEELGAEIPTSLEELAEYVARERPRVTQVAAPDGTVTIMFTDSESSTSLNERLGDARWMDVLRTHDRLIRDQVGTAGGTVVKNQGDGYMLAFSSARRAVECAVALQRGIGQLSCTEADVRVRMGLHTGEPVREADDFYGRDVAYAARVGSAASGGEILVSSLVKSLIEPGAVFTLDGPREHEFKGFDGPQPVFAVVWD